MNKVNYNTIIRFFKNECSEEERLLIIKWVNESQEHAEQFSDGKNCITWETTLKRKMT